MTAEHTRRNLAAVVRARVDRFLDRLATDAGGDLAPVLRGVIGTVSQIVAGGGADGVDLVVINWAGDTYEASHGSTYTPVVGHVVLAVHNGAQLAVIDRLVGIPPEV